MDVQIQQEPDSWEIVTEIDPLNVGEILGSIGGFWGRFSDDPNDQERRRSVILITCNALRVRPPPRVEVAINSGYGVRRTAIRVAI